MNEAIKKWSVIVVFLLLVSVPGVLLILGAEEQESDENRNLAVFPSALPMQSFPSGFDAYLDDRLPGRSLCTRWNSLASYCLGTSSNEQVLLAKDGWLFYNSNTIGTYLGRDLWSDASVKAVGDWLQQKAAELAQQGREFVLLVNPNKERVYSAYLEPVLGAPSSLWPADQLVSYLRENTNVRVVYPYEEMLREKNQHPDLPLYFRLDTHWNQLGAYVGAKALLGELGFEIPPISQLTLLPEETMDSSRDLANMLNLGNDLGPDYMYLVFGYAAPGVEEKPAWSYIDGHGDFYGTVRTEQEIGDERKLFVIRDSFFTSMVPYVVSCFQETVMTQASAFHWSDIERENPEIVVFEIVERSLPVICMIGGE